MENKNIVVWFVVKQPFLGRNPTKLVFTSLSQYEGMQQMEDQGKDIHLPIVSRSRIVNIPLIRGTWKHQMVYHYILKHALLNKSGKALLRAWSPPHVMPTFNLETHFNLVWLESPQPLLIFFQSFTPYIPWTSFEHFKISLLSDWLSWRNWRFHSCLHRFWRQNISSWMRPLVARVTALGKANWWYYYYDPH